MLKKLRVALAVIFIVGLTALFVDFTGSAIGPLGWMAKAQFWPAVLSFNIISLVLLILLTFVAGRIYCSVICPLGVMQDAFNRFGAFRVRKAARKFRFAYQPEKKLVRYIVFVIFAIGMIAGASWAGARVWMALIEPYSMYGRIAADVVKPVYDAGNNVLAGIAEINDSTLFYRVTSVVGSGPAMWVALISLFVVGATAFVAGREWCNTICPVGTLLGVISRFSIFGVRFDESKCTGCRKCERNCKAKCIDVKNRKVDYSRCVTCFNCTGSCSFGAMTYGIRRNIPAAKPAESSTGASCDDASRRGFMTGLAAIATASVAKAADALTDSIKPREEKTTDGGFADITPKHNPEPEQPIVPPGAISWRNFSTHCTACQLCVSACPNEVLKPSASLDTFMMPQMDFDLGYCRPECVRCSEVCPAGAIRKITVAEKSDISVGMARVYMHSCLAARGEAACGICARHCPSHAITMMPFGGDRLGKDGTPLRRPVVDESRCLGCGACENLCPVSPVSAIRVDGRDAHTTIG